MSTAEGDQPVLKVIQGGGRHLTPVTDAEQASIQRLIDTFGIDRDERASEFRENWHDVYAPLKLTPETWMALITQQTGVVARRVANLALMPDQADRTRREIIEDLLMLAAGAREMAERVHRLDDPLEPSA